DGVAAEARFYQPTEVARDASGNLYVADAANNLIRKITPTGVVSTLAGQPLLGNFADGAGRTARFSFPQGVAVDANGSVYVADTNNNVIRKITPDGNVSTLAGQAGVTGSADGTGSAALFSRPQGVAVGPAGDVFVADTGNQ